MNILFLWYFEINPIKGGVESVTFNLMSYFNEIENINSYTLSLKRNSNKESSSNFYLPNSSDFDIQENKDYMKKIVFDLNIDVIINQAGLDIKVVRFIKEQNLPIQIINVFHSDPKIYLFQGISPRLKLFSRIWGIDRIIKAISDYNSRRMYKKYIKEISIKSDLVLLLSQYYVDILNNFIEPCYSKKFKSIYNPIPTPLVPSKLCGNIKKNILFVGRLVSQKRIDRLLEIWGMLYSNYPEWSLTIVGDGPQKDNLLNLANELNIKNIHFTGFKDPTIYYQSSSILCITSDYEGLPMVQIESLQYGLAQISFDSFAAVRDIIVDEDNGYIIQPFDLVEYKCKLEKLMIDEKMLSKFRNNSLNRSRKFYINEVGRQWITLLSELEKKSNSL